MGRNVALEADVRAMGPRLVDPEDAEGAALLSTAKRAAFADRDLAGLAGHAGGGGPRRADGAGPAARVRDGRHVRRRVRGRDALLLLDLRVHGVAARGAAGGRVRRRWSSVRGPVRIGQGIEFDYCAVHAAEVLRREGWSAVMVNSNPETVSTDFDASTRLYFEPLDPESVRSIIEFESGATGQHAPSAADMMPAVVAFGGQTPLNLAAPLVAAGVPLLGSDLEAIDQAEERTRFSALLDRLGIPQPDGGMAESIEEALTLADRIGYPVIVRPSFVIGGLAIDFCLLARGSRQRTWPRRRSWTLTARSASTASSRASRLTWTPSPTAPRCSSRACSSTWSGPGSTRATRSACSRPSTSAWATRTSSCPRWSGSASPSAPGAWSTRSSSSVTTACT